MVKILKPKKILDGVNQPLEIHETAEGRLIERFRGDRSLRKFADYLNEGVPDETPGTITYAMIWNWETGVHPVSPSPLWAWKQFYPPTDARHQLAVQIADLRKSGNGKKPKAKA